MTFDEMELALNKLLEAQQAMARNIQALFDVVSGVEDKAWIREIIYESEVRILSAIHPRTLEEIERAHEEKAQWLDGHQLMR